MCVCLQSQQVIFVFLHHCMLPLEKKKKLSSTQSILESFMAKKAGLSRFSIKNAEENCSGDKVIFSRKDRNLDITMSIS